jgi:hypothetical protein
LQPWLDNAWAVVEEIGKLTLSLDLTNFCYSEATMQDNKTALLEIRNTIIHAFKNKDISIDELVTIFGFLIKQSCYLA